MTARRADTISFWVSVIFASVTAWLLGFQLSTTRLPLTTFLFAVVTSWLGMYLGLNRLYTIVRQATENAR